MNFLRRWADNRIGDSLAAKMRWKRFDIFKRSLSSIPRPIQILDLGGTFEFWERMGFVDKKYITVTILNIEKTDVNHPNFKSLIGDARDLSRYHDKSFDVVFSNSVIEHVGEFREQWRMADEIKRVGERYFVQTPNRFFPLEPHFLIPFFQFFPTFLKKYLARHLNWGWFRGPDRIKEATTIRLLTEREIRRMFPGGKLYKEKLLGLTKSFIIYKW